MASFLLLQWVETKTIRTNILKITTLLMYIEKATQALNTYRTTAKDALVGYFDEIFANQIKEITLETIRSYNEMKFRDVVKNGFFNLQSAKDEYLLLVAAEGPRRDLVL
jgi:leucyl-tRNA synthetase